MPKNCTKDSHPPLMKTFQRRVKESAVPDKGASAETVRTLPSSLDSSNGGHSLSGIARACERSTMRQEAVSAKEAMAGCPGGLLKSLRNRRTSVMQPFSWLVETIQYRKKLSGNQTRRQHLAAVKAELAELVAHFAEVDAFELVVEDAKPSPNRTHGHRDGSKNKGWQSGGSIYNLDCKTRERTHTSTPGVDLGVHSATSVITPAATARNSLGMQPHTAYRTIEGETAPQDSAQQERPAARSSPTGTQGTPHNMNSPPLDVDNSADLQASLDSHPSPDLDLLALINPDHDPVYGLALDLARTGIEGREAEANGSANCRGEPCAFGANEADRLVERWQSNDALSNRQLLHLGPDPHGGNLGSREGLEMGAGQETVGKECETAVLDALAMQASCRFSDRGAAISANSGSHIAPSFIPEPGELPNGDEYGAEKALQPLPVAEAMAATRSERKLHPYNSVYATQIVDGAAVACYDQHAVLSPSWEEDYVKNDQGEVVEGEEDQAPEQIKILSEIENGGKEFVLLQQECDKEGHDVDKAQGNKPQRLVERGQEAIGMREDTIDVDMEVFVVARKETNLAVGVCAVSGDPSAQGITTAHDAQHQDLQREQHPMSLTTFEQVLVANGQDLWGRRASCPVKSTPRSLQRDEGEGAPELSTTSTARDSRPGDHDGEDVFLAPAVLEMPITLLAEVARPPYTSSVAEDHSACTVHGTVERKEEKKMDVGLLSEPVGLDIGASFTTSHGDAPLGNVAGLQVSQRLSEVPALTPLQQLLVLCGQKPLLKAHELPKMDDVMEGLLTDASASTGKGAKGRARKLGASATAAKRPPVVKVGEGSYGEAWRLGSSGSRGGGGSGYGGTRCDIVIKVVPIEGNLICNEAPQKTAAEVMSEALMTSALSHLGSGPPPGLTPIASTGLAACNGGSEEPQHANLSAGFVRMHSVTVCRGPYPRDFVKAWERWDTQYGSENEPVSRLPPDQLYWIIAMDDSGTDLEKYVLESWDQLRSVLLQVAVSLAVAEAELSFEHRDLHWGNVLIRRAKGRPDFAPGGWLGARLHGRNLRVASCGVATTIIDFTNSRLVAPNGLLVFCDLSRDPELFEGTKGDVQYDTYRWMRNLLEDDWSSSCPATNCLWLSYLGEVLCKRFGGVKDGVEGKCLRLSAAQKRQLREFRKRALGYGSCGELVWDELFQGLLQADK